eukprot:15285-Amphidinium_carterae.1
MSGIHDVIMYHNVGKISELVKEPALRHSGDAQFVEKAFPLCCILDGHKHVSDSSVQAQQSAMKQKRK